MAGGRWPGPDVSLVKPSLNALAQCLTPAHGVSPAAPVSTGAKDVFIWAAMPGSLLMTLFLQKGWITRAPGYREVQVTDSGRAALSRLFNLKVSG